MAGIEVVRVASQADLRTFIDLPWAIYPRDSNWVPPLKSEVRHLLDTARHPFWKFAERELFIARRDGRPIGRIAAIIDPNSNRFHEERAAAFGFFECSNDREAAAALFAAATNYARDKGMAFVRGPLNPSTNYEIGMLIDGFEHPPVVMMPWNLPYYVELAEAAGFQKEKDLLAFYVGPEDFPAERTERLAKVIVKRNNISMAARRQRNFAAEMVLIKDIYHASWERSWGFVPMSDGEIDEIGAQHAAFRRSGSRLLHLSWRRSGRAGRDTAGYQPDPEVVQRPHRAGRSAEVSPVRPPQAWLARHGVRLQGAISQDRLAAGRVRLLQPRAARPEKAIVVPRMGWNLEDNRDINQFDLDVGGKIYKRYRIFRKDL